MFPLVAFDLITNDFADQLLKDWGHWLGGCNRPFGRQSFGLSIEGEVLAVAVSASTVGASCAGFARKQCVELARLCSAPPHRDLTRPTLRLWRKVAPVAWERSYWRPLALVSYQNAVRHTGDIYRFDGWRRAAEVKGSTGGGTYSSTKKAEAKAVWVFEIGKSA